MADRVSVLDGEQLGVDPIWGFFNGEGAFDPFGYTTLYITILGTNVSNVKFYYSDDQVNWTWVSGLGDGPDGYQPSYIFPVDARYYKVVNSGAPRDIQYYLD